MVSSASAERSDRLNAPLPANRRPLPGFPMPRPNGEGKLPGSSNSPRSSDELPGPSFAFPVTRLKWVGPRGAPPTRRHRCCCCLPRCRCPQLRRVNSSAPTRRPPCQARPGSRPRRSRSSSARACSLDSRTRTHAAASAGNPAAAAGRSRTNSRQGRPPLSIRAAVAIWPFLVGSVPRGHPLASSAIGCCRSHPSEPTFRSESTRKSAARSRLRCAPAAGARSCSGREACGGACSAAGPSARPVTRTALVRRGPSPEAGCKGSTRRSVQRTRPITPRRVRCCSSFHRR